MSSTARYIIAVVCIISGIGFVFASLLFTDSSLFWKLWLLAAICFISAACCFQGKLSAVTNRIIGGLIFILCVVGLVLSIYEGKWRSWSFVLNAIMGIFIWMLPAGYVIIYGHLPRDFFRIYARPSEEAPSEPDNDDRQFLRK